MQPKFVCENNILPLETIKCSSFMESLLKFIQTKGLEIFNESSGVSEILQGNFNLLLIFKFFWKNNPQKNFSMKN